MFYSRAAERLADLEEERLNRRRVTLRRAGGAVMLVLAALMYLGFNGIDPQARPKAFVYVWLGAIALLGVLVALALVDVRLTVQLRRRRVRQRAGPPRGEDPAPPAGTHTPTTKPSEHDPSRND
jgi:hypothetical protein